LPARADCTPAPASARAKVPVRIILFIIEPFIRTLLRSPSLTREFSFYSKLEIASVFDGFVLIPAVCQNLDLHQGWKTDVRLSFGHG
jgi:hypothetical protein